MDEVTSKVSYKELQIWQKGMDFAIEVYRLTDKFPKTEIYSLVSQIRRAAVSIPSNIAEGKRRNSQKDFRKFLRIAFASGAEIETQLELAKRLGYFSSEDFLLISSKIEELQRMLNAFIKNMVV